MNPIGADRADDADLDAGVRAAFADDWMQVPVDTVLRRARGRRRWRAVGIATAALLLVASVSGVLWAWRAGRPPDPLPTGVTANGSPTTFVAEYSYGAGDTGGGNGTYLSLFDAATGRHLRDLMHWPEGQQPTLNGFSRAANGDVWLAVQTGPRYRSNVASGDPKPNSCGGKIIRIDHATGRAVTVVSVGADATVGSPVLSPDGTAVAYLSGTCTGGFDTGVIVRELASGRQWQLQVAQAAISSVSWDSRGRIAIVAFLSVLQTGQPAAGFLITPSELNQTFDKSDLRQVSGGCNVQSATFDTAGLLVLQGCPTITDTARLTQLDASLHPLWSATPVATPNGAHLSVAADGRSILVSTWSTTATTDFVSIYSGPKLVTRYQYVNPTNSVTNAVW